MKNFLTILCLVALLIVAKIAIEQDIANSCEKNGKARGFIVDIKCSEMKIDSGEVGNEKET